jgi:tRNA-5-taurinomethyluridine 2-sulfurtransferase
MKKTAHRAPLYPHSEQPLCAIPPQSKIAALVSGGVDSAVALYLLREQGHDVTAFYLKVWMEDDTLLGDCPWQEDVDYVRAVCEQLGTSFEIVAMQREYWDRVVDYALREVRQGRTPNPDMMCNKLIKFGAFYDEFGKAFDFIASGHYALTDRTDPGGVHLQTSADQKKDQTYFLSQMNRQQLGRAVFPIGEFTKQQVRDMAITRGLANAHRPDSQGICFLGKINCRDFIARHVGRRNGDIVDQTCGKILGEHEGFWFYTIGQRFGLGLSGGPWFVVDKDSASNTIYVAQGYDPEQMYCDRIEVQAFNWINPMPAHAAKDILFKIRHAPEFYRGHVQLTDETSLVIRPEQRIAGVAKGQFAVLYHERECLGGGVIC